MRLPTARSGSVRASSTPLSHRTSSPPSHISPPFLSPHAQKCAGLKRYATKDVKKLKDAGDPATSGQYLLGAALSQSSVPDGGAGEAMQVTDMGILVNHAYSLIEVAEIGEPHQEKLRLVQLRNPWGLKEWEGPWSDGSREWETAMGRKAIAKLNVTFDGADGSFWMAWEDFQAHFNKIYVCRVVPYKKFDPERRTFVSG